MREGRLTGSTTFSCHRKNMERFVLTKTLVARTMREHFFLETFLIEITLKIECGILLSLYYNHPANQFVILLPSYTYIIFFCVLFLFLAPCGLIIQTLNCSHNIHNNQLFIYFLKYLIVNHIVQNTLKVFKSKNNNNQIRRILYCILKV